jgi:hypothetical protein
VFDLLSVVAWEKGDFAAMSGAQQGYYTDRQQYGTFQAPPFMQQPQIPSPGGMYYPSVPGFTLSVLPLSSSSSQQFELPVLFQYC